MVGGTTVCDGDCHEIESERRLVLAPLFAGQRHTVFIDSVLQGHMGMAYADDPVSPTVAHLVWGEIHYYGGDSTHPLARAFLAELPIDHTVYACVGPWWALLSDTWEGRLIVLGVQHFDPSRLDRAHLLELARERPPGYEIRRTDVALAGRIEASLGSPDHVNLFDSPDDFAQRGIGYCALWDETIVSAASSSAICDGAIEVQINTHADHRRRGLARAVAAHLLVECLDRSLTSHWATRNPASAALARQLGYRDGEVTELIVRVR